MASLATSEITPAIETTQYGGWTRPPGLVGDIADFIYCAAPKPLFEVALAGAIAYFAGIVGRAYNVGGMGLNQYIVVLADTGAGKNAAKTGIDKINSALEPLLIHGLPASPPPLPSVKQFSQRCRPEPRVGAVSRKKIACGHLSTATVLREMIESSIPTIQCSTTAARPSAAVVR